MSAASVGPTAPQIVIYLINGHIIGKSEGHPSSFTPVTPLTSAVLLTVFSVLGNDITHQQQVTLTKVPNYVSQLNTTNTWTDASLKISMAIPLRHVLKNFTGQEQRIIKHCREMHKHTKNLTPPWPPEGTFDRAILDHATTFLEAKYSGCKLQKRKDTLVLWRIFKEDAEPTPIPTAPPPAYHMSGMYH